MKWILGFAIAFFLGAGTRWFDIPAPAPPNIVGALLIVAITVGYASTDWYLDRTNEAETSPQVPEETTAEPASE